MFKIYIWDYCPFCIKVLNFFKSIHLKENDHFTIVDARPGTPGYYELKSIGGKTQVPFLYDASSKIYESTLIIDYVRLAYSSASNKAASTKVASTKVALNSSPSNKSALSETDAPSSLSLETKD